MPRVCSFLLEMDDKSECVKNLLSPKNEICRVQRFN